VRTQGPAPALAIAGWLLIAAGCGGEPTPPAATAEYVAEIEAYRAAREQRLRADDGWLTLIGLYWLEPGENRFGSDPENRIVLPADASPPVAGTLWLEGDAVRLTVADGATLTIDGSPVDNRILADDSDGAADVLGLGRLRFHVIRRDGRLGVRVKDPDSPARRGFRGLDYFPIDPRYRVLATFVPFAEPREVTIQTVLGTTTTMRAPGTAEFSLAGTSLSMMPVVEGPDENQLFFIFRDQTSGRETYGAGRFLYATLEGNRLWLDFNKAYNPPCAFTPFATCPLPPMENRLPLPVEAGEKDYGGHS